MILSIGDGMDETDCQTWINTYGLTHTVLADPTRTMYPLFGDGYIPFNAIIDPGVVLRYSDSGYSEPAIIATIESLVPEVLFIGHEPLGDTEDDLMTFQADATIFSNYDLISDELVLHWNLDGGSTFNEVILTPLGGDEYTSEIPAPPYGTMVYYYLSAADAGGNARTDPADAPTELYSFFVGFDVIPPVIAHEPLADEVTAAWPSTVSTTVTDNIGVDTVTLEFMINGGPVESVPFVPERDGVYSADFFGAVEIGDYVEYRIIAVDGAATPNTATDPDTGYHLFSIVDPLPLFIFEPDGTPLSGAAIALELDALEITYDMGTELPDNPSLYRTIFACLGTYGTNHVLTASEGQALADFLDNGGQLYMEGGDTWFYDTPTAVHPYFNINGISDGTDDAGPIEGAVDTFTEGMYFTYQNQAGNNYIDHIAPLNSAFAILLNVTPAYINGVAYDGGTYRTVGTSFEFGALDDGTAPSTKHDLLVAIMEFFEMNPLGIMLEDGFESGDMSGWSMSVP